MVTLSVKVEFDSGVTKESLTEVEKGGLANTLKLAFGCDDSEANDGVVRLLRGDVLARSYPPGMNALHGAAQEVLQKYNENGPRCRLAF